MCIYEGLKTLIKILFVVFSFKFQQAKIPFFKITSIKSISKCFGQFLDTTNTTRSSFKILNYADTLMDNTKLIFKHNSRVELTSYFHSQFSPWYDLWTSFPRIWGITSDSDGRRLWVAHIVSCVLHVPCFQIILKCKIRQNIPSFLIQILPHPSSNPNMSSLSLPGEKPNSTSWKRIIALG